MIDCDERISLNLGITQNFFISKAEELTFLPKRTWDLFPTQIWQMVSQPADGQNVLDASNETSKKDKIKNIFQHVCKR